jgi:Aminoacyl-tRNA editing domain
MSPAEARPEIVQSQVGNRCCVWSEFVKQTPPWGRQSQPNALRRARDESHHRGRPRRSGDARLSGRGSPCSDALGIEPSAVTPFAAMNDSALRVNAVLDAALMTYATINCHPLVNTMTTSIARDGLIKFLEATGHPPRIMAIAGPGPAGN